MNIISSVRKKIDRFRTTSVQLVVYPVPVNDLLTLHNAKGRIQFINAEGEVVRTVIIDSNRGTTVPVSSLSAGAYLLQIVKPDGIIVFKKVVKL